MALDILHRVIEMQSATCRAIAAQVFDRLREASRDGEGVNREAFGPRESIALDIVEAVARSLDLKTERDSGANLVITLEGSSPHLPYLACGSHLDSVPQGGNFDGAAGVVAGLIALASLRHERVELCRSLKLFALRGEESSRFGRAYLGSSALLGLLTAADLNAAAADSGRSLADCMADVGVDVDRVRHGIPLLDLEKMGGWLELHIEQGPVLAAKKFPIGIVTGIRGNFRHRVVECIGEAGHSGAVPRELRHDAIFATAELITRLDRHWRKFLERGHDLVVTSGVFGTDPHEHAIARIPGAVRFSFEARSQSRTTLEDYYGRFQTECEVIEKQCGVRFSFDRRIEIAPANMDQTWINRLHRIATELNIPFQDMASGAGHDAAIFANAGISTAMIFVRNENGSHNPREAMDIGDMISGALLMRQALQEAAS